MFLGLWAFIVHVHGASDSVLISDETVMEEADSAATDSLLPQEGGLPFPLSTPSYAEIRIFRSHWLDAWQAYRSGKFSEAAGILRGLNPTEKLAQVYLAAFFAEASLAAGAQGPADSALSQALTWVRGEWWQRHLYRLRLENFPWDSAPPAVTKEICLQALDAPLSNALKADLLYHLLRLDSADLPELERISTLHRLIKTASADKHLDTVYRALASRFTPGHDNWDTQKMMLDFESKLGLIKNALERSALMVPLVPGKSEKQALHWTYAGLWLRKGGWDEALKYFLLYRDRYGDSPALYLELARLYRKRGEEAKSNLWYDHLAEKFPRHAKAPEVFWMKAFDAEEAENFDDAVEGYARVASEYPGSQRAEWSEFRIGLVYFKRGDFDAALQSFRKLRKSSPSSPVAPAGLYWESKSVRALQDTAGSDSIRIELCSRFPFSFHGHLASDQLHASRAFPESLEWSRRMPMSGISETKEWLAAHAPGFADTVDESWQSVYLPVRKLLAWGQDTLALLTLHSRSAASISNPWELFVRAKEFRDLRLWADAARMGNRLSAVLPIELWPSAPTPVLQAIYPLAFEGVTRAKVFWTGLPPQLVFALMKQESAFNPDAVSSAGAMGLMQMLPATGMKQAARIGLQGFVPEWLLKPEINIRLGTDFLSDVVQKYDGNPVYVLAHYNAGPVALSRWMPRLSVLPLDESVEEIGFAETRQYVKRVMANYWTYRELTQ